MKLFKIFLNLFKRKQKELSFIDAPIKIRTIMPESRGKFNDSVNYYSIMKNY